MAGKGQYVTLLKALYGARLSFRSSPVPISRALGHSVPKEIMTRTDYANAYKTGYRKTVRFLCSRGVPDFKAEESAQAAWAKGWEKRDLLRRSNRVLQWVNTIALNIFRGRYRKQSVEEALPDREFTVPAKDPSLRVDLEKASEHCADRDWRILKAQYVGGYNSREIAEKLELKPVTVRGRLSRAKEKLRRALRAS